MKKLNNKAISEVIGSNLLLLITVATFSIIYVSAFALLSTDTAEANSDIICQVEGNNIIFSHMGGDPLPIETIITLRNNYGYDQQFILTDHLSEGAKSDGLWSMGEQLVYTSVELTGSPIEVNILDTNHNSLILSTIIPASNPIITYVNSIYPFLQTASPITITASSTGVAPDNVSLYYQWRGYWEDTFDNDNAEVSSYHNMSFDQGDYVIINRSGEGSDNTSFVDQYNASIDGISDIGTHSNFAGEQNMPSEGTDTLTEINVNESVIDYVDSQNSNIDSSPDIGTHSSFTAQQAGPDSIYDHISEEEVTTSSSQTFIDEESFEGTWTPSGWSETGRWNKENDDAAPSGGTYSADFDGRDNGRSGFLTSPSMDCSDADSITISFWYKEELSYYDELQIDVYDRYGNWDTYDSLGTDSSNSWVFWDETLSDSQYIHSNFQIRFEAYDVESNEHIYIDLVSVEKSYNSQNFELDLEVQWTNVDYTNQEEILSIYMQESVNSHSLDCSGGYMLVGDGSPDWGSESGTISFWLKWDSLSGYTSPWGQQDNMELVEAYDRLYMDWDSSNTLVSSTSFNTNQWYFIAITWNENINRVSLYIGDETNAPTLDAQANWYGSVTNRNPSGVGNTFMASYGNNIIDGHGDDLRYYDIDRSLTEIQSDYNIELAGTESNLRSYYRLNNVFTDQGPNGNDGSAISSHSFSSDVAFGSGSSENLRVDIWDGSTWQTLFSNLNNGWNSASILSYLTSSTLTIRFKDTDTTDTNLNSWLIDCSLLNLSSTPNYQLNLQVQWTDLSYSLPNEELCIYNAGSSGEELLVDIWYSGSWQTIISVLNPGWNNVSISPFLISDTCTIRFRGNTEINDETQDNWQIGSSLIHVWKPGIGIYYEGNLQSNQITKGGSTGWDQFFATVNNTADSTFSILDSNGIPLLTGLSGSGDDISSITDDIISIYGEFTGPVKLDDWKVTRELSDWTLHEIDTTDSEWSWEFSFTETGEYWFYSVGDKDGWMTELPPDVPAYDTSCKYES